MKEYIECITKHRAKHFVCEFCNEHCSDEPCEPSDCEWMQYIENEPAADVVDRKRGEWKPIIGNPHLMECSNCGSFSVKGNYNFCPECGSDMREVDPCTE